MTPVVRRITVVSVALLTFALFPFHLRAQEASSPPDDSRQTSNRARVLLLQDGGVLTGRIVREGDRYVVSRGGGQMEIAATSVMLVSESLETAYEARQQQQARPSAESHLALAEWCLRHGLHPQAERELARARTLDARHPKLPLLERRLSVARQKTSQATVASPDVKSVQTQPNATQKSPAAENAAVSAQVIERFTRKVQPVLVNNCTTSGCHQSGESFQLDRALLYGMANRRSTMNNLAATLALIDHQQPERSRLLTLPRKPHGGMQEPIIGPRQEQAYRHLVEWVALVTLSEPPEPDIAPPAELLADALVREERKLSEEEQEIEPAEGESTINPNTAVAPATSELDIDGKHGVVPASYEEFSATLSPVQPIRVGARLEKWKPRDEFDPQIFNRQQTSKQPAAAPRALEPVGR